MILIFCKKKKCPRDQIFEMTTTIHLNNERSEQEQFVTFLVNGGQNQYIGTIKMSISTNNWEVKTYRKKLKK